MVSSASFGRYAAFSCQYGLSRSHANKSIGGNTESISSVNTNLEGILGAPTHWKGMSRSLGRSYCMILSVSSFPARYRIGGRRGKESPK